MSLCLVIEDDQPQRAVIKATLVAEGYEVVEASSATEGRRLCEQHRPEVVLLDLGLPDGDGISLIPDLGTVSPMSRIVVLTGQNSVSVAVAALRAGARHYLVKPWETEELFLVVEREARAVDHAEARERSAETDIFWGSHPTVMLLRDQLSKLARSPSTPVLIEGETGTGKEVVARELHRLSTPQAPFIAMNCASIPSELMESELFGHERGAFTGAQTRRRGLAELARGGTLFLDEIGEMSLSLQAKMLRFLHDQRFRRVGGEEELSSSCRIVAATHQDLMAQAGNGMFRDDLYYRLSVVCLRIPPLRQRGEDLLPLTYWLLRSVSKATGRRPKQLSPEAEQALLGHRWPGNVRELKNRLERALVLGDDELIRRRDLDLIANADEHRGPVVSSDDEAGRIRRLLQDEGWNVSRAARRLGVERHWLRYRISKYALQPQRGGTR